MAGERILVVEDEDAQRLVYCEELKAAGYECVGASGAQEAEEILSKETFDLVVLDLNMPRVSGLELLPRIHELHPGLVVVIHTAYSSYQENFVTWLADAFVTKDPDPQVLVDTVKDLLEKSRQGQKEA
ncbi:MAG: response regulator [Armatimonadetes bacterium]|nr:response regulator [Armatimonadota bacterium]MDW8121224.1 response regulator [Armatimonadota bacterium]